MKKLPQKEDFRKGFDKCTCNPYMGHWNTCPVKYPPKPSDQQGCANCLAPEGHFDWCPRKPSSSSSEPTQKVEIEQIKSYHLDYDGSSNNFWHLVDKINELVKAYNSLLPKER